MDDQVRKNAEERFGMEYDLSVNKYYEVLRNAMEIKSAVDYFAEFCPKLKAKYSKDLNQYILHELAKEYTVVGNDVTTEEEYKADVRSFTADRLTKLYHIDMHTYYFLFYDENDFYNPTEGDRECHFMPYNHTYLTITLPEYTEYEKYWDDKNDCVAWKETPVSSYAAAVRYFVKQFPNPVQGSNRINCTSFITQQDWELNNFYSLFNGAPVLEMGFPPFTEKGTEKYYKKCLPSKKDFDYKTLSFGGARNISVEDRINEDSPEKDTNYTDMFNDTKEDWDFLLSEKVSPEMEIQRRIWFRFACSIHAATKASAKRVFSRDNFDKMTVEELRRYNVNEIKKYTRAKIQNPAGNKGLNPKFLLKNIPEAKDIIEKELKIEEAWEKHKDIAREKAGRNSEKYWKKLGTFEDFVKDYEYE